MSVRRLPGYASSLYDSPARQSLPPLSTDKNRRKPSGPSGRIVAPALKPMPHLIIFSLIFLLGVILVSCVA